MARARGFLFTSCVKAINHGRHFISFASHLPDKERGEEEGEEDI